MLFLAGALAIFVYGLIAAMLGTILPGLSSRFSLTPKQNGSIAFAQALGLMISSLLVGPLLDNEGKKLGLVLGLILVAIALLGLPRSGGFGSIAALLFVLGLGGGVVVTGANALINGPSESNLLNLFFGLGGMVTPFIAANLLKGDIVKLCYAAGFFAIVALAVQVIAPIPPPTGTQSFVLGDVVDLISQPTLLILGLMLFLYISCEVGIWNWLVQHLIAQGIPETRALNVLSLGFALGLLVGRLIVGLAPIPAPPETITLVAAILMAVTTYLVLTIRSVNAAWGLVFLAGVAMAPVFPTTLAIVGSVAPPRMVGTAIGLAITCGWAGLAVSSRVIGAIAGGDTKRLRKALLVIPASSVVMVALNLALQAMLKK
jgi:fucose permease